MCWPAVPWFQFQEMGPSGWVDDHWFFLGTWEFWRYLPPTHATFPLIFIHHYYFMIQSWILVSYIHNSVILQSIERILSSIVLNMMGWRLLSARDSHVGSLRKTLLCLGMHTVHTA
jgi:hypothetical protein